MIYYKKKDTAILAGQRKARAYRQTLQLFQVVGDDGFHLATQPEIKRLKRQAPETKVNVVMTFVAWKRGPYERNA
tara:strand:+ start:729 stop:953 length:225 start_codon:yes stop_codon:yes gene_type:complete